MQAKAKLKAMIYVGHTIERGNEVMVEEKDFRPELHDLEDKELEKEWVNNYQKAEQKRRGYVAQQVAQQAQAAANPQIGALLTEIEELKAKLAEQDDLKAKLDLILEKEAKKEEGDKKEAKKEHAHPRKVHNKKG